MKYIPFILFFALFSLSCKKKVQAPLSEFDAGCDCAHEVTADFWMEEMTVNVPSIVKYTDTDSILGSKNVRFRAKEQGAEYTWYIGSDVLSDSVFGRYFGPSTLGQTIPVTLVVKKKPNKICFPTDDGYDSIVKYLTVTNYPMEDISINQIYLGSIEGTYRVKSAHLPDSFDVTVDYVYDGGNNPKLNLFNYDGLGTNCLLTIRMDEGYNYRELFLTDGTAVLNCEYLQGTILHKKDDSAEMNFRFYYEGHPLYNIKKYLGRKL